MSMSSPVKPETSKLEPDRSTVYDGALDPVRDAVVNARSAAGPMALPGSSPNLPNSWRRGRASSSPMIASSRSVSRKKMFSSSETTSAAWISVIARPICVERGVSSPPPARAPSASPWIAERRSSMSIRRNAASALA